MNNPIKSKFKVFKYSTLFVLFFFFQFNLNAQTSKEQSNNLQFLNSYLSNSNKGNNAINKLRDLVYEANSSIYFYNGIEKTFGSKPLCLFTDVSGFSALSKQNLLLNDVELITIRIEKAQDLQSQIDLLNVNKFPNLKYIYILTTFDCDINDVSRIIINNSNKYTLLFKSEKES